MLIKQNNIQIEIILRYLVDIALVQIDIHSWQARGCERECLHPLNRIADIRVGFVCSPAVVLINDASGIARYMIGFNFLNGRNEPRILDVQSDLGCGHRRKN